MTGLVHLDLAPAFAGAPPHGSNWEGLAFEALRSPSPETRMAEYWVSVPTLHVITHGAARVKWRINRQTHAGAKRTGTCTFLEKDLPVHDIELDGTCESVNIWLDPVKLAHWFRDEPVARFSGYYQPHIMEENPQVLTLTQMMVDEVAKGSPNGKVFAEALSMTLITYLAGHFAEKGYVARQRTVEKVHRFSKARMQALEDYIREKLADNVSLTELASLTNLSARHFTRCFRETKGISPHQYILQVRIDKAKEMVVRGDRSMTEIALELGFASSAHFSDVFRRVAGISPSSFRLMA
jgi:AraC family transcriptional regulator